MDKQDVPMLIIYDGTLAGTRWPLQNKVLILGRAPDCDVVFLERQISRYHVRFERGEDVVLLRDLGSKNGTQINAEPVRGQPYRLYDGDEILLAGTVRMGYVAGEATLPLAGLLAARSPSLAVDQDARQVTLGRRELDPPLSPSQFRLLTLLMTHAGDVVKRQSVIEAIWPDARGGVTDQAVDALVYRLRERLAELAPEHEYVVTVRGHGFRFEE
ncbi:MAG: winged helix-turn-helix domain-containing protein [Chloroflexota bacterium]|nr:winged helix-turn-helix domain-containing protein [Chloroflexota bacterium]